MLVLSRTISKGLHVEIHVVDNRIVLTRISKESDHGPWARTQMLLLDEDDLLKLETFLTEARSRSWWVP